MRRIICARVQDTEEFDIVATTTSTSDATDEHPTTPGCPLAAILPHLRGESFDAFFQRLVEMGILQCNHGHYEFAEMPGPCPFTQAQNQTQPLTEQEQAL